MQKFRVANQPAPSRFHSDDLAARKSQAAALADELYGATPERVLERTLSAYSGRVAALSSFGAEAALGLKLLADLDPGVPVLFLDTHRHFPQTLTYRDQLISSLGLTNVQILEPDPSEVNCEDSDSLLYERDSLACCNLRKVRPLGRALGRYDAVITGRKRHHRGARSAAQAIEFDGERIRINPLALLSKEDFLSRFRAFNLPRHPMVTEGFPSIGCWPCTAPSSPLKSREGRWAGQDRTECGIFDPAQTLRARKAKSLCLI